MNVIGEPDTILPVPVQVTVTWIPPINGATDGVNVIVDAGVFNDNCDGDNIVNVAKPNIFTDWLIGAL